MRWNRIGAGVIDFFTANMFGTVIISLVVLAGDVFGFKIGLTGTNLIFDLSLIVLGFIYMIMVQVTYQVVLYN